MSLLRTGFLPLGYLPMLARVSVLVIALLLGACSSRQAEAPDARLNYVAANGQEDYVPIPGKVEVEDDGIDVQRPPVHKARHEPDDPVEPFSPNYGAVDPGVAAIARTSEPWIIHGQEVSDVNEVDLD